MIELELNADWLKTSLDDLKAARAMPGDAELTPVDQAADPLIAAIETILRVESTLQGYYETRAYRQDGLARGKAADPELKKAYEDAMTAMVRMEEALAVVQRKANDTQVQRLQDRGHVAEASALKAMGRAERMVDALMAEDRAGGDQAAAELQTALEEMRQNKSKLKIKDEADSYDLLLDMLTQTLAAYRDAVGEESAPQRVVPLYNVAVQFSNQLSIPK